MEERIQRGNDITMRFFGKKKKISIDENVTVQIENETENPTEKETDIDTVQEEMFKKDYLIAANPSKRKQFVEECCSQIIEAEKRIEEVKQEYRYINSYISDVRIVDGLQSDKRIIVENEAKRIIVFNNDREEYGRNKSRLSYHQYSKIVENEEEMKRIIKVLEADENYCEKVRTDMRYLEGEKMGLKMEHNELCLRMEAMAKLGKVSVLALTILLFIIWLYYYKTGNDIANMMYAVVTLGIVLVAIIFTIHQNSLKELKYNEARMNRAISLLNKIKLKYVNVASRLEYMYEKYEIKSSRQLVKVMNEYAKEEKNREIYKITSEKLLESEQKLVEILEKCGVKDAEIWLAETDALVDRSRLKEMEQKLEKRRDRIKATLDYNMDVVEKSKASIKELVVRNKRYAREIMDIVDSYNID